MPGRKPGKATCDSTCHGDLCCDSLEKGQNILKCEGECGCVVHRYCAGVTKCHFESLDKGHSRPFACQWCSMKTSKLDSNAVIEQLQSEIVSLKSELAATKIALAEQREQIASASSTTSYAAAVAIQPSGRR